VNILSRLFIGLYCRVGLQAVLLSLVSCATPHIQTTTGFSGPAVLHADRAVMRDGYVLPLSIWRPEGPPRTVVIALHGFNDYRQAFAKPAQTFAASGILTYAYDQRGFGETQQRGIWPGNQNLLADATTMIRLVCARHPDRPVYLMGESMGAAVLVSLLQKGVPACVDGVILIAPAVNGWQTLPLWQRSFLWLLAHTAPGYSPTGTSLDVVASDNREMLIAQGRDPLVIKGTRIDSVYGLVGLMDTALSASRELTAPALILYGEKDEIIPAHSMCRMLESLPAAPPGHWRLALYPHGYHMLTRDRQAEIVLADMLAWLGDRVSSLPSGYEVNAKTPRLLSLCAGSQQ
jgi:alpha-beta hydrolase superfamily lysophospholipase